MALLLGGYALGQGAMFVAQTWLVAIGEYRFLVAFGTHFLFAVLGIFVVDAGSISTLARHAAASPRDAASRRQFWQVFWDTSLFRMLLALGLAATALVYALSPLANGFSRNYALFAAPACLFFAGNATGLLDGFKFSGISGICGAIPYATSALGLALVRHASPEAAGATLGAAFSVGCLLTVAAQWIALAKFGWRPRLQATTARGLRTAAREGGAMLGVMMPGQLYGRAQLVLSTAYLGPEITAFFLYAKQVVSAVIQIIGLIQRVEFPTLVARLSASHRDLFRTIFGAQQLLVAAGITMTVMVFVAGLAVAQFPESRFSPVAPLLSAFSPTILSMTVLIMMAQALVATGAYDGLALDNVIFNLTGAAASYLFLNQLGVYAFVAADVISTLCGILLLALRLGRSKRTIAVAVGQQP
jgi:O-antigen/teichoic acid export membrane protein